MLDQIDSAKSEVMSLTDDQIAALPARRLQWLRPRLGLDREIGRAGKAAIAAAAIAWKREEKMRRDSEGITAAGRERKVQAIAAAALEGLLQYSAMGDLTTIEIVVDSAIATRRRILMASSERAAGAAAASTVLGYKAEVMKSLERQKDRVSQSIAASAKLSLSVAFRIFTKNFEALFTEDRHAKHAQLAQSTHARQSDRIEIRCDRLVQWAVTVVRNLPTDKRDWCNVAIALGVLTGRRQSEILSSAEFALPTEENHDPNDWIAFKGQLKRHSDEIVDRFDIPVLGSAAAAIPGAIDWLQSHGKRVTPDVALGVLQSAGRDDPQDFQELQQAAAKIAHGRYSKPLSWAIKPILSEFVDLIGNATWDYVGGDRRKFHLLRAIYAQIVYSQLTRERNGRGIDAAIAIAKIMGHSDRSSAKYSYKAYDSDVWVA